MEFGRLTEIIRDEDTRIVAIALIISEIDDKVIKVYRMLKLTRQIWKGDTENEPLKSYLHEIYWKLTKEVNQYRRIINTYGYKELSIVSELEIMNDWN